MVRQPSVSDPLVPVADGHTEVSEQDRVVLLPTYISTRGELFAAEEENIAAATFGRYPTAQALLDHLYLRHLHSILS